MKVRDSGMPEEAMWNSFFDTEKIIDELGIDKTINNIAEIGCGYGTFTIPAAKRIMGKYFAFDFENEMAELVIRKAKQHNLYNIIVQNRDVLTETTGLSSNSVDFVFLFNILHHENPYDFLNEAHRILTPGGKLAIIHWRSDIETPRGPDLSIRPKPEDVVGLIEQGNGQNHSWFKIFKGPFMLEPFHYGILFEKMI